MSRGQKDRPELESVRKTVVYYILIAVSIFSLPAVVAGSLQAYQQGYWLYPFFYTFFYITIITTACLAKKLPGKVSAAILVAFAYLIACGFSRNDRVRKAQELGAGSYIRKPYSIKKLRIGRQAGTGSMMEN